MKAVLDIPTPAIIIAGVLFLFGAGGMWINGSWLLRNRTRKLNWSPALGTITDVSVYGPVGNSKSYYPVITYSHGGVQYSFQPVLGSQRRAYRLGKEVPILVNPENPEQAVVALFSHLYGWPFILFAFCSIFVVGCFWGLWIELQKK